MICKIQGGGEGVHANSGSCRNIAEYLEHEDAKQVEHGNEIEPFFNQNNDNLKYSEMIETIDRNKGQLLKTDAKFFVVTIAPSSQELKAMGNTPAEQSAALKEYVNDTFIQNYADNFNKGLKKEDINYFAKIHHERGSKGEANMHAHIVISRKDMANKIKISPQTNHKGTSKGVVKGGFDRSKLAETNEKTFDKKFSYERPYKETYQYQHTMKNGTLEQKMEAEKKAQNQQLTKPVEPTKEVEKVKQQQNDISR